MCETGKRQFMRSPLAESEKAIGKASSTIAYVLNLSGAHAPMETMQQIGRQDPVAGRLEIVHDVNGGFQHYPSRLERKLDDDKKLADELEKVWLLSAPTAQAPVILQCSSVAHCAGGERFSEAAPVACSGQGAELLRAVFRQGLSRSAGERAER